jgi:hypothetical protein
MQFFENTTINVSDADAEKLISADKAVKVEGAVSTAAPKGRAKKAKEQS